MAATDMKERKDIPPGTKISCTTFHDVTHEGEVLAFDYHTKLLVIKTKGVKRDLEVKVINLSQVKHFDISEEAKHSPSPLVTLDMQKIKKRPKRHAERSKMK